jgi:hypothetical protein
MMLAALDGPPGTLTHESIHRGLQILRNLGQAGIKRSDGKEYDLGGWNEEDVVRTIMHDTMGDPQGAVTPKEYRENIKYDEQPGYDYDYKGSAKSGNSQWLPNGHELYEHINELNKRATKYILAQRAKGQRVDY